MQTRRRSMPPHSVHHTHRHRAMLSRAHDTMHEIQPPRDTASAHRVTHKHKLSGAMCSLHLAHHGRQGPPTHPPPPPAVDRIRNHRRLPPPVHPRASAPLHGPPLTMPRPTRPPRPASKHRLSRARRSPPPFPNARQQRARRRLRRRRRRLGPRAATHSWRGRPGSPRSRPPAGRTTSMRVGPRLATGATPRDCP